MVRSNHPRTPDHEEAIKLRAQAAALLGRLKQSRDVTEECRRESGRKDPMACITGRTAIDDAIETAEQMIHAMDRIIHAGEHEEIVLRITTRRDFPRNGLALNGSVRQNDRSHEQAIASS